MRKNLLLGCACVMSMFLLAACSGGSAESSQASSESSASAEATSSAEASSKKSGADTAAIDAYGLFTVFFDQEFPPMGFVDDNG